LSGYLPEHVKFNVSVLYNYCPPWWLARGMVQNVQKVFVPASLEAKPRQSSLLTSFQAKTGGGGGNRTRVQKYSTKESLHA